MMGGLGFDNGELRRITAALAPAIAQVDESRVRVTELFKEVRHIPAHDGGPSGRVEVELLKFEWGDRKLAVLAYAAFDEVMDHSDPIDAGQEVVAWLYLKSSDLIRDAIAKFDELEALVEMALLERADSARRKALSIDEDIDLDVIPF